MKKSVVVLLHIGYWVMYVLLLLLLLLFLMAPELMAHGPVKLPVIGSFQFLFSFAIAPAIFAFYFFYSILYPKFLSNKKIGKLFASGMLVAACSGIVGGIIMTIASKLFSGVGIFNDGWNSAIALMIIMACNGLANGVVGLVMKGFIVSYNDIQLKADLAEKNQEIELELIKAQINPHFLFNTINNIDVLISKDPTKASEYLNKLSDIMRFMLYETKPQKISLTTELSYIEKYIDLQKIRTSNQNYVKYEVVGIAQNVMIAPMLFIPFIENAFKYSENKKLENAIFIRVTIEQNQLLFECENKFGSERQTKPEQGGLGNELIKKRLQLIYPNMHQLFVTNENNVYKVKLQLVA